MAEPRSWQESQARVQVQNVSGEAIPPYACMELALNYESGKSASFKQGKDIVVDVQKPTSDGAKYPGLILFNSNIGIAANSRGSATLNPVALALFDSADGALEPGNNVGPKSGSWYLSALGKGFVCKTFDSGNAYYVSAAIRTIYVEPDSNLLELVKITSEEKDAYGMYPAIVQRYDPIGLAWIDLFACKVLDANA